MRPVDRRYFDSIDADLESALSVARAARAVGKDPTTEVEIPVAEDMADRVENILGIPGVAARVRELEGEMSREEAALALAADFAAGRVGEYDTPGGKIEGAVRTAVALLTEGVVAAPIEGIDRVEVATNDDGTEFVRVFYAGPIRSAGGTAQALSVLVADYTRSLLDIDRYKPRDVEIERYAEEVALYDSETGLQYSPQDAETKFIAEHCPIMLDGEATGEEEVEGFRDLERVDTNNPRGGMCLVLAEGIALKTSKIKRYTNDLPEVDWPWLEDLIDGTYAEAPADDADTDGERASGTGGDEPGDEPAPADAASGPPRAEPHGKYLRDLIAGRPVFGHPSEAGGFRLRYGRARNHGHATAGVHPAAMRLLEDFLAAGTQIKTERPGKAAGVVPVDSIDGPTVKLANGDVRRIDDPAEALEVRNGVEEIIDLGEYLVNYGEFVENNRPLAPASYTVEWWAQDLKAAGGDLQAFRDDPGIDPENPTAAEALSWAEEFEAPLHPAYTYLWHDLPVAGFETLADAVETGRLAEADGARKRSVAGVSAGAGDATLVLPHTDGVREALETLLVEHRRGEETITVPDALPLVRSLGFTAELERTWETLPPDARTYADGENAIEAVRAVAPFSVRERAPTRVGCRMGRPEKSEERELSPAVHTLFPIGETGGSQRDVTAAAGHTENMRDHPGRVETQVVRRHCDDCGEETYRTTCPACGTHTEAEYRCPDCDIEATPDESGRVECPRCGEEATAVRSTTIDVHEAYRDALASVGERESAFEILKGVKGLSSAEKTPEPIGKGILRAKHGVSAFKDGTVRYDMTDLPVSSIRPSEVDVTAERFRELGYEEDINGDPLRYDDQLVPLRVQDVILSDGAAEHMLRVADFVDDLLTQFYDLDPFYEVEEREDLVGELVFGMAPHTSAAVVARVVGFTSAAVGYAHPYFHAAKRRNCFHPETKLWYRDEDGEWNHDVIEAFVEDRLDDPREDDFGTLIEELDAEVVVPSVNEDGQYVRKAVEAVSKHPSTEHLIQVETRGGRSLTVTPDHSMVRWNGRTETVPAGELEEGDEIPAPEPTSDRPPGVERVAVDGGEPNVDTVERIQIVASDVQHTYCLTVDETHTLVANGLAAGQCDGDEDCVMLLMDGLLNFSKKYLPDQRGGSVAGDSRLVAVDPEGDVRFMTFGEFWEELDAPVERDGKFRKKTCAAEGWETYAFDESHEASLKPIEKAIRYRASEEEGLLRIETQFGRSIEITEHHSLFRYKDGIEEVAGDDLDEGDLILAPRELHVEPEATTIDVTDCIEEPYVVIDDDVEDFLTAAWEATGQGSAVHETFERGLSYRLRRRKIAYRQFQRLLDRSTVPDVPVSVRIGLPGSTEGIREEIDVDREFGWLLGVFVAEGTLSSTVPAIHNADEDVIDEVIGAIERTLGHEPGVRWSNKAYEVRFPAVFREVLYDLGFEDADSYDSSEKVVPDCIRTAPREVVIAFLEGFIAGDGSRSSDDNQTTIAFHTTSEDVKDGIVFLLHRLGLVANVSTRERDETRQRLYNITVSGGASDNPLARLLNGGESYHPKSLVVRIPDALTELREMDIEGIKEIVPKYLKRRENVSLEKLREMVRAIEEQSLPEGAREPLATLREIIDGDLSYLRVKDIERVDYDGFLYDLQVGGDPVFTADWLYAHNSMDAPLVMSSRIDPTEIDDEAHNVDIVSEYPRSFYEATREMADPGEVDIDTAADTLGTDRAYAGFQHTHDTADLALGPDLSAYKTLGSMEEKMDAQLDLARRIRAVDESDVAERIIEYHFLPDLLGNLRAFSRQETRCLDCGEKYRRPPLSSTCRECGGDVNLTVHEGSVDKYMETAIRVAEEFDARDYTKQRLEVLERSLERTFEDDHNKQSGIADFM
ncbi:MAG: DNA polymerase II large subunit [Halobacteriales archaeon]